MQLNETIEKELLGAIKNAVDTGASFPFEWKSGGNINHLIAIEKQASGYLIDTIQWNETDYLIYLI